MLHEIPARTFVIVATHWVVPPRRFHEKPFVEVVAGATQERDSARVTLITRDPALIDRVLQLEGRDDRVTLTWRQQTTARRRLVLEAIA